MKREEWRAVVGFPAYEVSNLGAVRNIKTGLTLKPYTGGRYPALTLYQGRARCVHVHRVVCEAFCGPAPSPLHEVAHRDGDSRNSCADNLRWATHVENEADKLLHGTSALGKPSRTRPERLARGPKHGRHTKPERTARGERNGLAKLTAEKVANIRSDPRGRLEVARDYGISRTMVGYIVRGLSWAHVPMPNQEKSHG